MQAEAGEIAEQLLAPGPIGAFTLLVMGIIALHKGYIRLGREVAKLEADLFKAEARADRWQELAVTQLQQTDRAIAVAKSATAVIATSGAPHDAPHS